MKEFDHIGIVTSEPHDGESWVEFSKVWVTNPRLPPRNASSTYVQPRCPRLTPRDLGLWKLWHLPHIAFRVDDLAKAMEGEEVIFGPFQPGEFGTVAFVHKDGAVVEYIEYSDLEHWFRSKNTLEASRACAWRIANSVNISSISRAR